MLGTELSASPSHNYNVVIFVVYLNVFDLLMNAIDDDSCMCSVHVFNMNVVIL